MNIKNVPPVIRMILGGLLILLTGLLIGRYTKPQKVVTKTVTQTVTKVVTKTVEVDKTNYHKNKILIETIITRPDGTVIKERKFVDKSILVKDDTTKSDSKTDTKSSTTTEKEVINSTDKTFVGLMDGRNFDQFSKPVYGVYVDRKLLGPLSVGAWGLTDKTLGLSVGVHF